MFLECVLNSPCY